MSPGGTGLLGPGDIVELRAYERVREDYRRRVIELKRRRRVAVGPIVSVLFECAETVRFQIQEMARAERIVTDEGIAAELEVYNGLVPTRGELSATVFIELTSQAELTNWLPRLGGIERALVFEIGDPAGGVAEVAGVPEATHADALTREEATAAVHYVRFPFDEEARARLAAGEEAALVSRHPAYEERTPISSDVRAELVADLEGTRALQQLA